MNDDPDDGPDDDDLDDEPTYPCPGCGVQVYEEADACPYCGEYLSWDDPYSQGGRPWWVWLGAVIALATMALMAVALMF